MVVYMETATTTRKQQQMLDSIESNDNRIAGCTEMLAVARRRGMEYMLEVIERETRELEDDNDWLRDELIESGYEPTNV